MKTLVLPGFSIKNKEWAHWVKDGLTPKFPTVAIEWQHWETGNTEQDWIAKETQRVVDQIGEKQVNIIAKSIGTLVVMNVLKLKPEMVNKLILCGVPLSDLEEEDKEQYEVLKTFPNEKVFCIQNKNDNHGSFQEVKEFLNSINSKIKIISKPTDNHDYPYLEEFKDFLGE